MRAGRLAAIAIFGLSGWLAAAGFGTVSALASPCADGATCTPSPLTDSGTEVATITQTLSGQTFNMQYTEEVDKGTNEFCSGCLTWILKLTNTSSSSGDTIETINISNFSGFSTDMGVDTSNTAPSGLTGGSKQPTAVHPNGTGSVLNWQFQGSSTAELAPGQTTVLLEAETNATTFTNGLVSAQDGSTITGPGYAPSTEPNPNVAETPWVPAMGLAGGVALGGFLFRRRERGNAPMEQR